MKTVEHKIEIMSAWLKGVRIQAKHVNIGDESAFVSMHKPTETEVIPSFNFDVMDYRIAPYVPASIDWSAVNRKAVAMTTDANGKTFVWIVQDVKQAYTLERDKEQWLGTNVYPVNAEVFASFRAGRNDWRDSFVARDDTLFLNVVGVIPAVAK